MIAFSFGFLVIALIFAPLGFRGLVNRSNPLARLLFFTCLMLFLATTLYGMSHPPA